MLKEVENKLIMNTKKCPRTTKKMRETHMEMVVHFKLILVGHHIEGFNP